MSKEVQELKDKTFASSDMTESKNSEPAKVLKPTRTISGVAPITVVLPPRRCDHGACTYCPTFINAPQAYTPDSPAIIRAREDKFDPYKQVKRKIENLKAMGHPVDKIELIVIGGTFPSYERKFKFEFIKRCYDAMNESFASSTNNSKDSEDANGEQGIDKKESKVKNQNFEEIRKGLSEAKKINETASHRCVAMCIETRPDCCTPADIQDFLEWGATRVEIGVQAPDDEIYRKTNRCHNVQDVIDATKRLKEAGFKLGYHLMPGLYGSSPEKDMQMFKDIVFGSPDFRPDQIKIYPCQVVKSTTLEQQYYAGEYVPYDKETVREIIIDMLKNTPRYCRVMRIMRAIPSAYLIAGITNLDMRHDIEEEIRSRKIPIKEIRFREIGFELRDKRKINTEVSLKVTEYEGSKGRELFIEAVNSDDILFGLLRLRLDPNKEVPAMVRELHVYGPTLEIGEKAKEEWQHRGLGKELMKKAESIAKENGYKTIRVISGIGVREYYYKLGYKLDKEGIYVEKEVL